MRQLKTFPLLLATLLAAPASADDPPRPDAPMVGIWVLKSATVNGKPSADLSGLLKEFGGAEIGMEYRFRKDSFGSANDVGIYYDYHAETKELSLESDDPDKHFRQVFGVKMSGKVMQLRFKEKGKTVVLSFASED